MEAVGEIRGIPEERHAGERGQGLVQELQPFGAELRAQNGVPGVIGGKFTVRHN